MITKDKTREIPNDHDRVVRQTVVSIAIGDYMVSTVQLNNAFNSPVESIIGSIASLAGYKTSGYESMVFKSIDEERYDSRDLYARKYDNPDAARMGHQIIINGLLDGSIIPSENRASVYDNEDRRINDYSLPPLMLPM